MELDELTEYLRKNLDPGRKFKGRAWAEDFAKLPAKQQTKGAKSIQKLLRSKFGEWKKGWVEPPKNADDGVVVKAAPKNDTAASTKTSGERQWKRDRGYALEHLLYVLCVIEELSPKPSYRGDAQQIDGAFRVGDRRCIIEAKWEDSPLALSKVLTLRGRVDSLLVGTLGVFVSISGYAPNIEDNLKSGHPLNIILLDKDDLDKALCAENSLRGVIDERIDDASFLGHLYRTSVAKVPAGTGKSAKKGPE